MAGYGHDEEDQGSPQAGSSKVQPVVLSDDMDSGSEFAPGRDDVRRQEGQGGDGGKSLQPGVEEDEVFDTDNQHMPPGRKAGPVTVKVKKGKSKATASAVTKPSVIGPTLSRTSGRQQYILPTPSVHHRHRAVPLYSRTGRVERLASRPSLFQSYDVVMTNNFTQNAKVTDRVNKSWGYNVGWGPLWDLVEDRGWYKEAAEGVPDMDIEGNRRPKVYRDLDVKSCWENLSER